MTQQGPTCEIGCSHCRTQLLHSAPIMLSQWFLSPNSPGRSPSHSETNKSRIGCQEQIGCDRSNCFCPALIIPFLSNYYYCCYYYCYYYYYYFECQRPCSCRLSLILFWRVCFGSGSETCIATLRSVGFNVLFNVLGMSRALRDTAPRLQAMRRESLEA